VTKAPTIITKVPAEGHTGSLQSTSIDHHISMLVASRGNVSSTDPIWCRLSFNGRSRGCRCQKFAIVGKTVESQSRGGDMSWPMPCEVRRNHGQSSTSIDPSCTHDSTISNITCFALAFWYTCLKPEHLPVGNHSCTTGNRSQNLCYDSWSLGRLGYLYPGTTPVMVKLWSLSQLGYLYLGQLLLWSSLTITGVVPGYK